MGRGRVGVSRQREGRRLETARNRQFREKDSLDRGSRALRGMESRNSEKEMESRGGEKGLEKETESRDSEKEGVLSLEKGDVSRRPEGVSLEKARKGQGEKIRAQRKKQSPETVRRKESRALRKGTSRGGENRWNL